MATFGELLRRHRVAASLTQADLADQSGLSRRAIADLERGARARPREATLARIVAALRLNAPERAQLEAAALHGAGDPDRVALLPAPLSSFIGRESERSELVSLARARRLVTLTGAGGIGRTRLAIEVATELQHEYTSGARMVDLAAIASPLHVLTACAATVQALLENCRELHVLATSR